MILSFGWTWPAFVARAKRVTRREWDDNYRKRWTPGQHFDAYDRSPRFGGKHIGTGQATSIVFKLLASMPDTDYVAEGFQWFHAHQHLIPPSGRRMFGDCSKTSFDLWRGEGGKVFVVRFEIVDIAPWAQTWLDAALCPKPSQRVLFE
jgi:hypothetical protein